MRFLLMASTALLGSFAAVVCAQEKRVLGTAEIQALIEKRHITSGITADGWAFLAVNRGGGQREVYVNDFQGAGSARKETVSAKDGRLCAVREGSSEERCFEVHHAGGDRYEAWLHGRRYTSYYLVNKD